MRLEIERSSPIKRSARVSQLEGLFDVMPAERSTECWTHDLPLDVQPWAIGLIVGPSGCGKSTLARETWPGLVCEGFSWSADRCLLDDFPQGMSIKEITGLLSSVGFASPPQWLRPFGVLSTGQQMRVVIARLLAEHPVLAIMDEFTSVVDRTVAQIGSFAIAKAVRRRSSQQFVAVTCHEDVEAWLQPDWIYRPDSGVFAWGSLQCRPSIEVEVVRVQTSAWQLFKPFHYLSGDLNPSAVCFMALYQDRPVAFVAVLPMPGKAGLSRISRSVCLPEYQGVGIGLGMMKWVGAYYRGMGRRLTLVTVLSSINVAFQRSENWRLTRAPSLNAKQGRTSTVGNMKNATQRLTSSWEYVGPVLDGCS